MSRVLLCKLSLTLTAASLAAAASLHAAHAEEIRVLDRNISYTEGIESGSPYFAISYPGYSREIRLDCRSDWDGSFARATLGWDAYAVLEPRLDSFFAAHRGELKRLAESPACTDEQTEAIGEILREGSFRSFLTSISSTSDAALVSAFRAAREAGRIPAPIDRSNAPAEPVRGDALIVTHASAVFDSARAIESGLDRVVAEFKAAGKPVIYLMNDDHMRDFAWLASDRSTTLALASTSGEHSLEIDSDEITSAGGFFELCQADTITRAARSHFKRSGRPFTVNFPMSASYSDAHSYRIPGRESEPIAALLRIGHFPTLREAYDVLGARDFARSLSLTLYEDGFRLRIYVDGELLAVRGAGKKPLNLKFWSAR